MVFYKFLSMLQEINRKEPKILDKAIIETDNEMVRIKVIGDRIPLAAQDTIRNIVSYYIRLEDSFLVTDDRILININK